MQRLAIARALLHRPRVLLLDEPHSGLDPHAVDILDGLLGEIRAEHTFVMVTHNMRQGLELADQVMILDGGRIVFRQTGRLSPRPTSRPSTASTCGKGRWCRPMGLRQFRAMVRKDIVPELRTREMLVSMFLFVVLAMIVFHYAFTVSGGGDLSPASAAACSGWCSSSAPCWASTARSPTKRTRAASTACCCARSTASTIFLAKMTGNLIFLVSSRLLAVPVFALLLASGRIAAHLPAFLALIAAGRPRHLPRWARCWPRSP